MVSKTDRRNFLQTGAAAASICLFNLHVLLAAEGVPQSVQELWADFDPRKDPLETEVIREFKEDGAVIRHVRFLVGMFKGQPARMTAINEFPEAASGDAARTEKLPAVKQSGDRRFDNLTNEIQTPDEAMLWQEILDQLNLGEMPPKNEKQPTKAELLAAVDAITQFLADAKRRFKGAGSHTCL